MQSIKAKSHFWSFILVLLLSLCWPSQISHFKNRGQFTTVDLLSAVPARPSLRHVSGQTRLQPVAIDIPPTEIAPVKVNVLPLAALKPRYKRLDQPGLMLVDKIDPDSFLKMRPAQSPHLIRLGIIGAVGAGAFTILNLKLNDSFKGPDRTFRVSSDWTSDHAMQMDEFLHFSGSYHLTQAMAVVLGWSGFSNRRARLYSGLGVATAMTTMEFLDGLRGDKPSSVSDFAANLSGVAFALIRPSSGFLQRIDFSISVNDPRLIKRDLRLRFEKIRAWVSYSLHDHIKLPVSVALGYGVQRPFMESASRDYYVGIGLNLAEIFSSSHSNEIQPFDWLGFYRISPAIKL